MGNTCECVKGKPLEVEILSIEDSILIEKSFIGKERETKELDEIYPCPSKSGREAEKTLGTFKFKSIEKFKVESINSAEW